MHNLSGIKNLNGTEAPSEPLEVLASVGVGSLQDVPFLPHPKGYRRTGRPFSVSVAPASVEPEALPSARKWLRETGAQFVAFVTKGAITGELQAFEPIPA